MLTRPDLITLEKITVKNKRKHIAYIALVLTIIFFLILFGDKAQAL